MNRRRCVLAVAITMIVGVALAADPVKREVSLRPGKTSQLSVREATVVEVTDQHIVLDDGERNRKIPIRQSIVLESENPSVEPDVTILLSEGDRVEFGRLQRLTVMLRLPAKNGGDDRPQRPDITFEDVEDVLVFEKDEDRTKFSLLSETDRWTLLQIAWDIKHDKEDVPKYEGRIDGLTYYQNARFLPRDKLKQWLLNRGFEDVVEEHLALLSIPDEKHEAIRLEIALMDSYLEPLRVRGISQSIKERGMENLSEDSKRYVRLHRSVFGLEKPTVTVQWLLGMD